MSTLSTRDFPKVFPRQHLFHFSPLPSMWPREKFFQKSKYFQTTHEGWGSRDVVQWKRIFFNNWCQNKKSCRFSFLLLLLWVVEMEKEIKWIRSVASQFASERNFKSFWGKRKNPLNVRKVSGNGRNEKSLEYEKWLKTGETTNYFESHYLKKIFRFAVSRYFWIRKVSKNRRNDPIPWKVIISRDFVVLLFLDTFRIQRFYCFCCFQSLLEKVVRLKVEMLEGSKAGGLKG